jgi:hypothetical protein
VALLIVVPFVLPGAGTPEGSGSVTPLTPNTAGIAGPALSAAPGAPTAAATATAAPTSAAPTGAPAAAAAPTASPHLGPLDPDYVTKCWRSSKRGLVECGGRVPVTVNVRFEIDGAGLAKRPTLLPPPKRSAVSACVERHLTDARFGEHNGPPTWTVKAKVPASSARPGAP